MSLLWLNGTLTDKLDARVSPFDHGLLYGDGVWEHLRVFNGTLFRASHHIRILFAAAQAVGIDIPLSEAELLAAIETTVKANNRTEGYVRVVITRGPGTIGPDPRKIEPQVIVIAEEYQPFPHELAGHGLHAVVSPLVLDTENPAHRFRTLNQLHVVRAKQHALQNGCLESLFRDRAGHLIGATEGFLFVVKDGALVVAGGQSEDATGYAIAAMAGDAGLVVAEYTITLEDLLTAEEAFIAGTACGVIGIVRVDGKHIRTGSEGPITRAIREGYQQLTRGESR
ncbi:branched-chain amino acid aminotransferase : Branched chain amino acid aminotransferase apoenzyme OS=Planctomyces brasiliensis (strain ATCC 49424 / DSM 5305 / JCM 21570 / NBRC 103401 / IFAM 1448) GN=Plabr_2136 PE=3 SV=1: Aminotran_4 [Gemmata massiliana]|uniref:Aminotransferase class IV n=1 Tax=Gemmata massiliana TaxID=1210884 RepID=A0A6P2CT22_9BACT|nr:aminotransferase class IV [Gemmata massiliana]VTR92268.1 branched-chain amino acid aminotransferase : Branched chain amino acid aminotransferase apoenzyme OS=Planctomyces brasiliensis (strain ATCC 49424 / DSM 5305 / JCM 21570 / NBRC 103401 / IFAM 1448) GN=Plabr_2136 PE=3 SV=1: Aminotran_4 [Gemmata massiliana]